MADDELTKKLSRRLQLSEKNDNISGDSETSIPRTNLLHEPDFAPLQRRLSSGSSNGSEKGISCSATDELSKKLSRRQDINDGAAEGDHKPSLKMFNPYTEFKEFSRKQIKEYENVFKLHDINKDHFIDMEELKRMMEKLGAPQTHLALKHMIFEVDEDKDGRLNFREISPNALYRTCARNFDENDLNPSMVITALFQNEKWHENLSCEAELSRGGRFLLIFRKAAAGELQADSGLSLLANLTEIDVDKEGVGGAKNFFEAKIDSIAKGSRFEEEIRAEQEQHRKEAEDKRNRRQQFKEKAAFFTNGRS